MLVTLVTPPSVVMSVESSRCPPHLYHSMVVVVVVVATMRQDV